MSRNYFKRSKAFVNSCKIDEIKKEYPNCYLYYFFYQRYMGSCSKICSPSKQCKQCKMQRYSKEDIGFLILRLSVCTLTLCVLETTKRELWQKVQTQKNATKCGMSVLFAKTKIIFRKKCNITRGVHYSLQLPP